MIYNAASGTPAAVTASSWGDNCYTNSGKDSYVYKAATEETTTDGVTTPATPAKLYKLIGYYTTSSGTIGLYKDITSTLSNGDLIKVGNAYKAVTRTSAITIA